MLPLIRFLRDIRNEWECP